MRITQSRRQFLTTLSVAGAGLVSVPTSFAAEGALETTTVRLAKPTSICAAPLFVAEELLRAEGFTDIRYLEIAPGQGEEAMARGKLDFSFPFAVQAVRYIDAGKPVTVLAGVALST
jgi:NitT/TauT family transport system substrate-binding protein